MKDIFDQIDWIVIIVPAIFVILEGIIENGFDLMDLVLGVVIGVIIGGFILLLR